MPQIAFDLWKFDYTTDGGKQFKDFPFRTKRSDPTATNGSGNTAVNAVKGAAAYVVRDPDAPCVGSVECITPRKLICVLADGETLSTPIGGQSEILTSIQALVGAGCVCVHLEGEIVREPQTFLFV